MMYQLLSEGVINLDTNQNIPNDPGNAQWKVYQKWLALGNTPDSKVKPGKPTRDQEFNALDPWIRAIVIEAGINPGALKARVNLL